eukprot:UN10120
MNLRRPKNILHLSNLFVNLVLPQATIQQMIFFQKGLVEKFLLFFDQTFHPQIIYFFDCAIIHVLYFER